MRGAFYRLARLLGLFALASWLYRGRQSILCYHAFAFEDEQIAVTASFGVAPLRDGADMLAFIKEADELLYVAKKVAAAMAETGYRPPLPANNVTVAGDVGLATLKMALVNMLEGRFISEHDNTVATRIGDVLCGGAIERGSQVDEEWLLDLERKHFFELAQMPKTQERIAYTLTTGKPLRN